MDHRLVEYAAMIPSRLKIRGLSDTKYIYRKILEGTLPKEILYGRPKLGHSVPMKNWMRSDRKLQNWFSEFLSDETLKKRGLFQPDFLHKLLDDHLKKRQNNSHRLWGLFLLELWMRKWLDS